MLSTWQATSAQYKQAAAHPDQSIRWEIYEQPFVQISFSTNRSMSYYFPNLPARCLSVSSYKIPISGNFCVVAKTLIL